MEFIIHSISLFYIELLKLVLILVGLLNYKPKKVIKKFILETFIAFNVVIILMVFSENNAVYLYNNIYYIINCMIIVLVIKYIEGKSKVLITFVVYTSISLFDVILVGGIQLLFDNKTIMSEEKFTSVINALSILVILILLMCKKKVNNNLFRQSIYLKKRYLIIILLGMIGLGFYVAPIQMLGLTEKMTKYEAAITIGVYTSGIIFIIICVVLLILNDSNIQYKQINDMNQKLLDQQRLYYQTLIDKEQYTKRFRHDINNHIYCMYHLCEKKKYEELMHYLNDMNKFTIDLNFDINTGNSIVNIIVNDLYTRNKNDNIDVIWKGYLPENIHISSMDLCTIFSNLLSNAIEAVKKLYHIDSKTIEVIIKSLNTNLVIQINNPVNEKIDILNNRLITTKKNKDYHGFGSINIEKCVEKYGGDIQYSCTDNLFTASIVLPNVYYDIIT